MTHLHTDHVGWNTVRDGRQVGAGLEGALPDSAGRLRLLEGRIREGRGREQGSFPDSVLRCSMRDSPISSTNTKDVAGCLTPEPVPGHAPGMLSFRLRSRGEEGLFTADVLHNAIQIVHPHWNDRYCLWPDQALDPARRRSKRAAERGALIMPMHLGAPYCGYVRRQGEGYVFEAAT